jgi:hypothetical protein
MDCNRIPNAKYWKQASVQQLQEYRRHAKMCFACRRRVLSEAPEQLLAELDGPPMPDEFWLGFWDSLEPKLPRMQEAPQVVAPRWARMVRWAAVCAAMAWLVIITQNLPESPSYEINRRVLTVRPVDSLQNSTEYPLIESVGDPAAHYYIFQAGEDSKIVMIINPDMDL